MKYVFRTENAIDRQGTRWLTVWRREVLDVTDTACHLGPVERAHVLEGKAAHPEWEPAIGILGSTAWVDRERMKSTGYQSKPPREIAG